MKKTIFIIALVSIIAMPYVTYASWYNPVSWFQHETVASTSEIISPPTIAQTATTNTIYVSRTVKIIDPKLQQQIIDLQNQLATAQGQIATMKQQIAEYENQIAQLQTIPKTQIVKTKKTSGELYAEYRTAHPISLTACNGEDKYTCARRIKKYTDTMYDWINQQLVTQ